MCIRDSLDTIIFSAGDTKSGDFLSQPINDFFDGFDLKFYSVVRLLKGLWTNLKQKKGWVVAINGQMANTQILISQLAELLTQP